MNDSLLPKTVNILGFTAKVLIRDLGENLGEFDAEKMEIRIDPNQTDEEAKSCLFHECLHMAIFCSGLHFLLKRRMEEALVRAIEHALNPLIYFKPTKKKR